MTVDEPALAEQSPGPPDTSGQAPPARTTQQQAIDTYQARLRTWRWVYAAIIAVVVAATLIVVKVAYSHGEISHATLRTDPTPPASVALLPPRASVQPLWNTSDRTALGQPNWGGSVVTSTTHSVRGRNAVTGAIMWSYTRTDRLLCDAIQDFGTTIVFFELHGDCDEVTALDSQTGARKWTRTLDKDDTREGNKSIQHIIGHPTYAIGQISLLVITRDVIYDLDPAGGLDRWTYGLKGCAIHGAVLGTKGALISQTCSANVACQEMKFCGKGPQLVLRNGSDPRADDAKNRTNPDQIIWNRLGIDALPVSADQVISAVDSTASALTVFDSTKGKTLATLQLQGAATPGQIAQVNTARAELVWVGGVTYSIETTGTDFFWRAPSTGPPTATPLPGSLTTPVDLNEATVLVPSGDGVNLLDPGTGTVKRRYAVSPPAAGSSAYPMGSGFVVTGPSTAVYR